jgi:hypothetical protein
MKGLKWCIASRKTTLSGAGSVALGIAILLTALGSGELGEETIAAAVAAIVAGVGLLFAKDGDKSTKDLEGKKEDEKS